MSISGGVWSFLGSKAWLVGCKYMYNLKVYQISRKFFGYDQNEVRDSNFVVGHCKSFKKMPKLQKNCPNQ